MRASKTRINLAELNLSPEGTWIVDVALIRSAGQQWHCALVQDLKTKRVLGWASAPGVDPTLIIRALDQASTRCVRPRPTTLYLDSGRENTTPQMIAKLSCMEFQLRFMQGQELYLLKPLGKIWRALQAYFTEQGKAPKNDDWLG